ncbi:MAG: hypothetical protein K2F73_06890 [Ruminococcus sp.]|nr:hypothetical protein [Ruminococcus sp.]
MGDFEANVRRILIEKLEEMSEIEFDDCANDEYATICSVMNDIAKTLLNK